VVLDEGAGCDCGADLGFRDAGQVVMIRVCPAEVLLLEGQVREVVEQVRACVSEKGKAYQAQCLGESETADLFEGQVQIELLSFFGEFCPRVVFMRITCLVHKACFWSHLIFLINLINFTFFNQVHNSFFI